MGCFKIEAWIERMQGLVCVMTTEWSLWVNHICNLNKIVQIHSMMLIIIPLYLYSSNDEQFQIILKDHLTRSIISSVASFNQDTKLKPKVQISDF